MIPGAAFIQCMTPSPPGSIHTLHSHLDAPQPTAHTHTLPSGASEIAELLTRQFLYVDERQWDRLQAEVFVTEVRFLFDSARGGRSSGDVTGLLGPIAVARLVN